MSAAEQGQPCAGTLAEVLDAPDELTCRRLLALLRPVDRRDLDAEAHPKPVSQIGIVSIGGEQVA